MKASHFRFAILLLLPWTATAAQESNGSAVCAPCHAEIYRKYALTGMARSSGRVDSLTRIESFDRATFQDSSSGASFQVSPGPDAYRLQFSRGGTAVRGERLLRWYVGSGNVGRSYLFSSDGFLFQSPVSYFTQGARWDVSPGFQRYGAIYLTRPVEPSCLQCHATRLQPRPGTQNGFGPAPFLENGVGCERCHGPGQDHIARHGAGGMVNPAKLTPARRDSVCAQCHMAGAARIARSRADGGAYRPGMLLTDYSAFFVWAGPEAPEMRVTSHFERLQQSACKKASGDRLWCGTCHDPHEEPAAADRAAYYRSRCGTCHRATDCRERASEREALGDNCIACHMPKGPVRDSEHAVYTDHAIPRRPAVAAQHAVSASLIPFWTTVANDRDLGLAYATVAGQSAELRARALTLLKNADQRQPDDPAVLTQLAQLYDGLGDADRARDLNERILRKDPGNAGAATNLGTILIQRGRAAEAMRFWRRALEGNPGLTGTRINLAVAQYRSGDAAGAKASLEEALSYDPDSRAARELLSAIQAGK